MPECANPSTWGEEDTRGLQHLHPSRCGWKDPANGSCWLSMRRLPWLQIGRLVWRVRETAEKCCHRAIPPRTPSVSEETKRPPQLWDTQKAEQGPSTQDAISQKIRPKETRPSCNANKHRKYKLQGCLRFIFFF